MADIKGVKERGLDKLQKQYIAYTISRDENGKPCAPNPNGIGPWSSDATKEERAKWQRTLDETGVVPDDAKLTRHLHGLAKWVAHTEEIMNYKGEIPAKVQRAAENAWAAEFKEPKVQDRKQTVQMFLALPPSLVDKYGGHPPGILWTTNAEGKHLTVEQVGQAVAAAYPDLKYKDNPTERAKVDIGKFNRANFSCQEGKRPDHKYPLLGLPEPEPKQKATKGEATTAQEAETAEASA